MMYPGRPAPGETLCALDDLADPGSKGFRFRLERSLFAAFVVRRGDQVFGYVDSCPHAGWPLAGVPDRFLTRDDSRILCAGHGALFEIEGGLCVAGPCAGEKLETWPVAVVDGVVVTA
jgi:nitrite reductase/ring-hydroxylating ferredoxin subunit